MEVSGHIYIPTDQVSRALPPLINVWHLVKIRTFWLSSFFLFRSWGAAGEGSGSFLAPTRASRDGEGAGLKEGVL